MAKFGLSKSSVVNESKLMKLFRYPSRESSRQLSLELGGEVGSGDVDVVWISVQISAQAFFFKEFAKEKE